MTRAFEIKRATVRPDLSIPPPAPAAAASEAPAAPAAR
jgi:hypothetical protein